MVNEELIARLQPIYDVLHDIRDRAADEGDRAYFGSTNDPETMQEQLFDLFTVLRDLRQTANKAAVEGEVVCSFNPELAALESRPAPTEERYRHKQRGTFYDVIGVAGGERLGWHMPDNLRWLAEQSDRPAYVPCGMLTGMFLQTVAESLEGLVAEKYKPTTPERAKALEEAARAVVRDYPIAAGTHQGAVQVDDVGGYGSIRRLAEALEALSASPPEVVESQD